MGLKLGRLIELNRIRQRRRHYADGYIDRKAADKTGSSEVIKLVGQGVIVGIGVNFKLLRPFPKRRMVTKRAIDDCARRSRAFTHSHWFEDRFLYPRVAIDRVTEPVAMCEG